MADSTTVFAAKDESFSATVNRLQQSLGKFEGTLSGFNDRAANMGKVFVGLATKVAALGVAFLGIRGAVRSMGAAIELGGQLNDLSARTGETAGRLMILQRAFENAGAGASSVGPTINRLQRNLVEAANGAKAQADAFNRLGLSAERLKEQSPTEQLQTVARALRGLENDSERTNLSMLLLGRSGGELIPLFRAMDEELARAARQVGSAARIMDQTNASLDRINDNFKTLGDKSRDFAVGLLSQVAPSIAAVTDRLTEIDAAAFGEQLSVYLKRTMEWATETFKLGTALKNVEVALAGIAAGNFGDGLKLIFLTARDTAFNAINEIYAKGMAALKTAQGAILELFHPQGVTMRYIEGAFRIVAAAISIAITRALASAVEELTKILPSIYRQIGEQLSQSFLPGVALLGRQFQQMADDFDASPIAQGVSKSLREAEKEAKSVIRDTSAIMYYEADNLKNEWGQIMAEAPKVFGAAYKQYAARPLIDMQQRVVDTADQMERVARATRAAAFDAEKFGSALRAAQIDRLAGIGESASMLGKNEQDRAFPWQGAGARTVPTDAPTGAASRSSSSLASATRATPEPLTRDQRVAQMRANAAEDRLTRNVSGMIARGAYGSAVNAQMRGERASERILGNQAAKDFAKEMFGGKNMGESFRNMTQEYRERFGLENTMGMNQRDFEKWAKEQAKAEKEREREGEAASGGTGGGAASNPAVALSDIYGWLRDTFFTEFKERLPQNALT